MKGKSGGSATASYTAPPSQQHSRLTLAPSPSPIALPHHTPTPTHSRPRLTTHAPAPAQIVGREAAAAATRSLPSPGLRQRKEGSRSACAGHTWGMPVWCGQARLVAGQHSPAWQSGAATEVDGSRPVKRSSTRRGWLASTLPMLRLTRQGLLHQPHAQRCVPGIGEVDVLQVAGKQGNPSGWLGGRATSHRRQPRLPAARLPHLRLPRMLA